MAVPKRKMSRSATRSRKSANMRLAPPRALAVPELRCVAASPHGVQQLRLVPRPPGPRRRVARAQLVPPVIAIDAMGGDRAPGGDRRRRAAAAVDACDVDVLLVGDPDADRARTCPSGDAPARRRDARGDRGHRDGRRAGGRRPREEGLVDRARRPKRCATGAPRRWSAPGTPAPRWPRRCCGFGRIKGVHRPAIARAAPRVRRRHRPAAGRRRRDRRPRSRVARRVGAARPRVRARSPRRRRADDRAAVERRGAGQG